MKGKQKADTRMAKRKHGEKHITYWKKHLDDEPLRACDI